MSGRLRDYETRRAMRLALHAMEAAVATAERRQAALQAEDRGPGWTVELERLTMQVRNLIRRPDPPAM